MEYREREHERKSGGAEQHPEPRGGERCHPGDVGCGKGGVEPVPEPASASLLILGALGLLGKRPRRA